MHRLVIALTSLLGLAGAATVAISLFLAGAGADQAARLAPADTALYVNVLLQPASGQRAQLAELTSRLPGFADASSLDAKIDQVAQNLLGQAGVDYSEQIEPWLGDQVGLALSAEGLLAGEPTGVALVTVRDEEAAAAALADLVPDAESRMYEGVELHVAPDASWALVGGLLAAGATAEEVEAVVNVARGATPSLADDPEFGAAIERLAADRVGTFYADLVALSGGAVTEAGFSVAAGALVIDGRGLRFEGSATFDADAADAEARAAFALAGEPSSLVDWMPADTQAELVVFGLRQALEGAEAAAADAPEGGEALTDALATVRTLAAFGLGIDLDADVLPLFDREVAVAVSGLDTTTPHGQLLLRPSDPDAAAEMLARITEGLEGAGASVEVTEGERAAVTVIDMPGFGQAAYALVDGIVIVGLETGDVEAAIEAHDGGTTLASTEAYRRTFELAGDRAGNEVWVDVAAIVDATGMAEALPTDVRDILNQIGAFGLTAPARDDAFHLRAVLTVE
jgi:hypothetical protein